MLAAVALTLTLTLSSLPATHADASGKGLARAIPQPLLLLPCQPLRPTLHTTGFDPLQDPEPSTLLPPP